MGPGFESDGQLIAGGPLASCCSSLGFSVSLWSSVFSWRSSLKSLVQKILEAARFGVQYGCM